MDSTHFRSPQDSPEKRSIKISKNQNMKWTGIFFTTPTQAQQIFIFKL
jgi:hypothetical protein